MAHQAKNVQVWDIAKKQKLHEFDNRAFGIFPVALSPDNKTLAYANDKQLTLRDVAKGTEVRVIEFKSGQGWPGRLSYSPKGDLIVINMETAIVGWDTNTGEQRFSWPQNPKVSALSCFFDNGKKIASGSEKGVVTVWDVETGKPVQTLQGEHARKVSALAPTADGKLLVSAAYKEPLKVWDLATGKVVRSIALQGFGDLVTDMVFLPDGATLIYPPGDKTIIVEDARTGRRRAVLKGHTDQLWSLALTPDGSTLVSASHDDTFKVWDLKGLP